MKNIYTSEDTIKTVKRQGIDLEKIFGKYISNKVLTAIIYII